MKIAFISDIHGNYPALTAVLEKIDELGVKSIFCLGDTVGYFPDINECISTLRFRGILSVIGNHDWYLIGGRCLRSTLVNECIDYQKSIIENGNLKWLESLPIHREFAGIRMVHGGWSDPLDEYLHPTLNYFDEIRGNIFVSGHSHKSQVFYAKDKVWCNPGSVGRPRDGDWRPSFALLDQGKFQIYRVNYDIESYIEYCQSRRLNKRVYEGLRQGIQ